MFKTPFLKKSLVSLAVIFATSQITACSSDDDKIEFSADDIQISVQDITENNKGAVAASVSLNSSDDVSIDFITLTDARFEVAGNEIKLKNDVYLDFEKEPSVELDISVTVATDIVLSKSVTVNVVDVLDTYSFIGALTNENSVSYSGQVARHVLIAELNNYISSGLQADLENNVFASKADVYNKLVSFFESDDETYELVLSQQPLTVSTSPERKQNTLADISGSTKDLKAKIAGNDATGQHENWLVGGEFVSFAEKGQYSPESLILELFDRIAANAEQYLLGSVREDQFGNAINKVYLGEDGHDYKQLIQKILLGAVTFSQGTDDYLDDDLAGKGLNADHVEPEKAGKPYTALEHAWDEGFGYFGAAVDYLEYTDEEVAIKGGRDDYQGMHDFDADGTIDLTSEYVFGHAANAAKRDRGTAANTKPTDYSANAMNAFIAGRQILAETAGTELTESQMTELKGHRDTAVANWEYAIAATAVHYINDVTGDYNSFGQEGFSYENLAKHWSELKGFVISLQFNPRSPLSSDKFAELNGLIADAPALTADTKDAYLADLAAARALLQEAYQFDAENVTNW